MLTDVKEEIDCNTVTVGDFNTLLTPMDRSSKQKINMETQVLNVTLHQTDLTINYRTFYPKVAECTFFSNVHGTISRIGHILGDKSSISKVKKNGIISSIFSNHNTMRLEINYKKKLKKHKHGKLNNMLLNNQWITEENKEEIKNT